MSGFNMTSSTLENIQFLELQFWNSIFGITVKIRKTKPVSMSMVMSWSVKMLEKLEVSPTFLLTNSLPKTFITVLFCGFSQ